MQLASSSYKRPVITFLTDFGFADGYLGVMKGVVLTILPDVQLVDITHDVAPQCVEAAAWLLATCYRYFPSQTIHVCVVDPGVGSVRRPIALHAGNWFFVGPDNGLFSYVLAEQPVHAVVALSNPAYHLKQVSSTFHGRDVFSPVAAHLANGVPLAELGPPVDPLTLQRIDTTPPERQDEQIVAHVVHIDHFGNLISNIPFSLVPDLFTSPAVRLTFPAQGISVTRRRRFFADQASTEEERKLPFLYVDSSGYIAVAIQNGNAAKTLGVEYAAAITFGIANT
jgi:S-adenosyl-L-methionine hydrolase (adenosine-forming)